MDDKNFIKDNKYSRWYYSIVYKAKNQLRKKLNRNNSLFVYYEKHHILPVSIYPEYKNLRLWPGNAVLLTAKEHFVCHKLLTKMFLTDVIS